MENGKNKNLEKHMLKTECSHQVETQTGLSMNSQRGQKEGFEGEKLTAKTKERIPEQERRMVNT